MRRRAIDRDKLEAFEAWEWGAFRTWRTYTRTLERWKEEYAPKAPNDELAPRYVEACTKLDYADCIFHKVFVNGDFATKVDFYTTHKKEVEDIARRFNAIGKADVA